jgi:hypothetical protein
MRRAAALLIALGGGLVCVAQSPATAVVVQFRTPTGNIGCVFSAGLVGDAVPTIRCEVRSRLSPEPRRPANCPEDYGDSVEVTRRGHATLVCHRDTAIDPHSRAIAYGHIWRRDGITCASRVTGLTCTNLAGHGFFLSRERWRIF